MFDVIQAHESSWYGENRTIKMLGQQYDHSCTLRSYYTSNGASYYLKGQYKTIEGIIGNLDGARKNDTTFYVYLDGTLYKEFKIGELPEQIAIDVVGVQIMKIHTSTTGGETEFGFGNVIIK
jgi:hypothetical protein